MRLGEFRKQTAHLPDNCEIVLPTFIDEYQALDRIVVCNTLMQVDCFDFRHWTDLGMHMPPDETHPTIIIDTIESPIGVVHV